MNVAAVQFKPAKGDKDAALAALVGLARSARGASLVVLPEMAATGYVFAGPDAIRPVAEPVDGPTFDALAPVAREIGAWLVVGFPERAGDRFFNSALVLDPRGERRFVYRKTLLYDADVPWATPGDSGYRRFEASEGAFGVGICMDLNDDAFVAWCEGAGLDAIAFPTNWIEEGEDVWSYWAWRLQGTDAALVAANTYGPEEGTTFSGRSAVLQRGRVLASAAVVGDCVVAARASRR